MWKPTSVVAHHRKRAIFVWVAILIIAVGYSVSQVAGAIRRRQNPPKSQTVSNHQYRFPSVTVCLEDEYGCGYMDSSEQECIDSVYWAFAYIGNDNEQLYGEPDEDGCIRFDLNEFDIAEGERGTAEDVTAHIEMEWVSSDNATAESVNGYTEGVSVYLGGDEVEEYTMVPYSRNVNSESEERYRTTAMTIGKTSREYLSGVSTTNYHAMTISTTTTTYKTDEDVDFSSSSSYDAWSMGTLYLDITQGSYSLTEIRDIDPLELGTLFGNVGGFWELLVLAWGVFFISASRETEPTLKARNFAKPLQRASSRINKKTTARQREQSLPDDEQQPGYDAGDNVSVSSSNESGTRDGAGRSRRNIHKVRSAGSRRPTVRSTPLRRKFPEEPNPARRRSESYGARSTDTTEVPAFHASRSGDSGGPDKARAAFIYKTTDGNGGKPRSGFFGTARPAPVAAAGVEPEFGEGWSPSAEKARAQPENRVVEGGDGDKDIDLERG